jgi:FkbM family methyltransferase
MTFEDLKTRGRRLIARKRSASSVRALHRLATFFDDAYENDEWDMCANGETSLIRRLAPARFGTAFDVGAHIGQWSVEALRAWPGAHVHAFEVAEPTFEGMKSYVDRAGLSDRATLNCLGLADLTTAREMYYFPEYPNLTCDLARHTFPATRFVANLIAGDDYVERHGISSVDFIKIDVEGAEHLVLKGLRRSIDAGRISCIQFEYGAFSIQTRVLLADYYAMLPAFWIGKIFPTHVEFRDYEWTMEDFRFSNFLAVLRERPDLKRLAAGAISAADRVA